MQIIDAIKTSPVFMNAIFDQMHAAVFIIDQEFQVMAFNGAFQRMVGLEADSITQHLCGNVLGCYYSIRDQVDCGKSAFCDQCSLRLSVERTLQTGEDSPAQIIEREFVRDGEMLRKYFRYTIKPLSLNDATYALLIIDDITAIEEQKASLLEQNALIMKMNAKFQRDLEMAKRVQDSIIPKKSIRLNDYTVDFRYYPLDVIGGDMFDLYIIDNDRMGILMCDVVGHGLPAALITTMIKALVEASRHLLDHPKAFIRNLNRKLISILGEAYLSAIYGVLDTEAHTFHFVRAGHPHPLRLGRGGLETVGAANNLMLGIDESTLFLDDVVGLQPDTAIILFTDGLLEAQTTEGPYETNLMALLETTSTWHPEALVNAIDSDLSARMIPEKHEDDICFLVIGRSSRG